MTDEAANIVPFGKYRGQPVEAMMADQNYCAWALTQPGLRAKFPSLIAVIVNGGTAPDAPTPEHNRMQLLFRNPDKRLGCCSRRIVREDCHRTETNHGRRLPSNSANHEEPHHLRLPARPCGRPVRC
jgi:hypothetical protein